MSGLGAQVVVCDLGQATSFTKTHFTYSMGTMANLITRGAGLWKAGSPPQSRFGTWGAGTAVDRESRGRKNLDP